MGTDTIPVRSDGSTITHAWFDLLRSVLDGNLVPRDNTGTALDGAGNIGDGTYNFAKLFVGLASAGISIEQSVGNMIVKVGGTTVATIDSGGLQRSSVKTFSPLLSSSSGNFQTSSSTLVDVTNLSVGPLVTVGKPVFIGLIPDGSNTLYATLNSNNSAGNPSSGLHLFRDDGSGYNEIMRSGIAGIAATSSGQTEIVVPPGAFFFIDPVSSGSHSYKLQGKNFNSSTLTVANCKMVAWEMV